MTTATLEIIQLDNGDIVLQRCEDNAAVVTINFSDEAKDFMADAEMDIAKVMIQAGIQAAAHISEKRASESAANLDESESARVLH